MIKNKKKSKKKEIICGKGPDHKIIHVRPSNLSFSLEVMEVFDLDSKIDQIVFQKAHSGSWVQGEKWGEDVLAKSQIRNCPENHMVMMMTDQMQEVKKRKKLRIIS